MSDYGNLARRGDNKGPFDHDYARSKLDELIQIRNDTAELSKRGTAIRSELVAAGCNRKAIGTALFLMTATDDQKASYDATLDEIRAAIGQPAFQADPEPERDPTPAAAA